MITNPVFFFGKVEDVNDPEQLGRVRVRLIGYHTENKSLIPTESLYWSSVQMPATEPAMDGYGESPTGIMVGSFVFGIFYDGMEMQRPLVLFTYHGIDKESGKTDVNPLAYGQLINEIIEKNNNVITGESIDGSWSEHKQNVGESKYPMNKVFYSRSGHVREIDDSPGKERLLWLHKIGSYLEMLIDGNTILKSVKDTILVAGKNFNQFVGGGASIKIVGSCLRKIGNNETTNINGVCTRTVGKEEINTVDGETKYTTPVFSISKLLKVPTAEISDHATIHNLTATGNDIEGWASKSRFATHAETASYIGGGSGGFSADNSGIQLSATTTLSDPATSSGKYSAYNNGSEIIPIFSNGVVWKSLLNGSTIS